MPAMYTLAIDETSRDALAIRVLRRASEITWKATARKTIAAYEVGRQA